MSHKMTHKILRPLLLKCLCYVTFPYTFLKNKYDEKSILLYLVKVKLRLIK